MSKKSFTIIYTYYIRPFTSQRTLKVFLSKSISKMEIIKKAAIVSGGVLAAGVGATLLVPVAMSTFGTVVAGTGTIHLAGGVAASLQSTAAACTLSNSVLVGVGSIPVQYLRAKL